LPPCLGDWKTWKFNQSKTEHLHLGKEHIPGWANWDPWRHADPDTNEYLEYLGCFYAGASISDIYTYDYCQIVGTDDNGMSTTGYETCYQCNDCQPITPCEAETVVCGVGTTLNNDGPNPGTFCVPDPDWVAMHPSTTWDPYYMICSPDPSVCSPGTTFDTYWGVCEIDCSYNNSDPNSDPNSNRRLEQEAYGVQEPPAVEAIVDGFLADNPESLAKLQHTRLDGEITELMKELLQLFGRPALA